MENAKSIGDKQVKTSNPIINRLNFSSEVKDEKTTTTTLVPQVSLASSSGNISNGNINSPKMGSRRIFTPQFKLQVLESYRNDSDCKGNQRATARKYNIHRRQIQKWLQCESSLRSSVANLNHNTVKHQFHNINMQQQTQKNSIPANSSVSVSYGPSHQHSARLSPDAARPMLVPPLATGVSPSSSQTRDVFSASDLAAVVAAATEASGAITIPSTSSSTITSASTKSPYLNPPLRPSAIIGVSRNTSATMSPLLHHHHYGIPSYSHTAVGVPLSVPILTHHISHPQHIHQQTHQPQQSYQYHNLAYTQTIEKQRPSFLSSISLPTVNALSTAAIASSPNGFAAEEFERADGRDALHLRIKTSSEALPEINGYMNYDEHNNTYAESSRSTNINDAKHHVREHFSVFCQFKNDGYPLVLPLGPMDLSLRSRREVESELLTNLKSNIYNFKTKHSEMPVRNDLSEETNIVDLTYRKRKIPNTTQTADELKLKFPEKQSKLEHSTDKESYYCNVHNTSEFYNQTNSKNFNEEDDAEVDIEVGTEEKSPPSKPVKLFKPYLLDGNDDNDNSINNSNTCAENEHTEFNDTNIWKSLPNVPSVSPSNCYSDTAAESCQENNFQATVIDNCLSNSSNFLAEVKTGSLQSALCAATTVPILSPTTLRCPKGSPASSGYESSTSTYSESSLSSRSDNYTYGQTYSINLQMHSIYNDNIVLYPSKHVQRWLDQEQSNLPATNSSIALFV